MLIDFFYSLRAAKLPVSVKEYLTLLEALKANVIAPSLDEFYYLARITLVKDEQYFDKFDRAFGAYFKGVAQASELAFDIPLDWLKKKLQRDLSPEEKAQIEAMGGLDKLMERLKELFDEQKERHEGGNKWIGTGGTSPFGNGGYNPEGVRIGGDAAGNRTAVKVWEARAYRDYDDQVEIGTRNIKIALRRLRRFAREGAAEELDLPDTIRSTAANAGWLDLKMVPERHNKVKVLMLLDVGGSMDDHIKRTEELFSAAKAEFKHRVLLLPQLRVRLSVEEQPPPSRRAHADVGRAAQIHVRLQADLRRRRDHEPIRSAAAGRLGGVQQRRSRRRMAAPPRRSFPAPRVAQSRTGRPVGVPAVGQRDPRSARPPHVPAHARRPRDGHAHAEQIAGSSFTFNDKKASA